VELFVKGADVVWADAKTARQAMTAPELKMLEENMLNECGLSKRVTEKEAKA